MSNRSTVILRDTKDWKKWIELIKTTALKHDIWKYSNPSVAREKLPLRSEPNRPTPRDAVTTAVQEDDDDEVSFATLKAEEREYFRILQEQYSREIKIYDKQQEALADLRIKVQESVYVDMLRYTFNCDDVHAMLVALKERFAPNDKEREQELILEWKRLLKSPAKNQDIDLWLDKWEITFDECSEQKLPDVTGTRPHYDFLNATAQLNSS